ncbi:MAG: phage tail tape measure protein [Acidobacteria bacterium]|nr:MAG: phage tail tape measure protein [Acidobacteriota bacterium]
MPDYNLGTASGLIDIDTSGIDAAGRKLTSAGKQMIGFGTVLTGGFVASVGAAANFEKEISTIAAVTAAGADEIDTLRQAALDLGSKGPFGPTEVAQAFVELAKAGLTAQEVIDGAGTATINLAKAGDLPIARAAEIAANAMRTFGIEAKDVNGIVDTLAGAANQSTLDVDDLATSLRYTGGIAAGLNIPLDDVATALALLGNAGIKGSTGGTSLRKILIDLSPTSKVARGELEKLGIITSDGANRFFDAQGKAKDLSSIFTILRDATKGLTDEQKINAVTTVFGARASASALILMEQAGQGFVDMDAAIAKTDAATVAATRLDNLSGSMRRLKAAVEAYLIDAGSPFQKQLQTLVEHITSLVNALAAGDHAWTRWILLGTALVGVLFILMGAFALFVGTILRFITSVRAVLSLASLLGSGLGSLATFLTTTLIGGILVVILALIALGVALYILYKKNEAFHKFVDAAWQKTQAIWDKVLPVLYSIGQAFIWAGKAAKDAWDASYPTLKRTAEIIWIIIQATWEFLKAVAGALVRAGQITADVAVRIGQAVVSIINFFRDLPGNVARDLGIAYRAVVGFFASLPGLAVQGLAALGQAFLEGLQKLPYIVGFIIGFIIGAWLRFEIWYYTTIVNLGIKAAGLFWQGLQLLWDYFLQAVGWLISHAIDFAQAFPGALLSFLDLIGHLFIDGMTALVTFLIGWIGDMVTRAFHFSTDFVGAILQEIPKLPGQLSGVFLTILSNTGQFVVDMIAKAAELGLKFLQVIWDNFKELPSQIINAIKSTADIASFLVQTGEDIIRGLINGIKNMAGHVKDAVGDVVKGIKDGFKSGFGLFSPSKVTTDYGKMIGQGLVRGMQGERDNMIKLIDTMEKDINGITSVQRNLNSTLDVGSLLPVQNSGTQPVNVQSGNKIDITVHNPSQQTAEDSMFLTAQKLQYLGVL